MSDRGEESTAEGSMFALMLGKNELSISGIRNVGTIGP